MKGYYEIEHYLRESDPDKRIRAEARASAIGLQAVDGLQTSCKILIISRRTDRASLHSSE